MRFMIVNKQRSGPHEYVAIDAELWFSSEEVAAIRAQGIPVGIQDLERLSNGNFSWCSGFDRLQEMGLHSELAFAKKKEEQAKSAVFSAPGVEEI